MKSIIIIQFFIISVITVYSQDISLVEKIFPTDSGEIKYQEVVNVDSTLTATQLYLRGKSWIAEEFNSAQDVIQMDEDNKLIVKAYLKKGHNSMVQNPQTWFTLKLEVKEGKYRYTLTDIRYEYDATISNITKHTEENFSTWLKYSDHQNRNRREKLNKAWEEYAVGVDLLFTEIINDLKKAMEIDASNDEW